MIGLRFFGLLVGVIALFFLLKKRRQKRQVRGSLFLPMLLSIGLVSISALPTITTLPATLLSLNNVEAGRIIALQLIGLLILFVLFFWERSKNTKTKQTLNRLAVGLGCNNFCPMVDLKPNSVWVVIPALNEEDNLKELLPKIPSEVCGLDVIPVIIDDGSTDNTLDVARSQATSFASLPTNFGGGVALLTGFALAIRNHASIVVTMDADNQHNPNDIESLVSAIVQEDADLVIGSRHMGDFEKVSTIRSIGLFVFNWLINFLQGTKITDCASGFRAIRCNKLQEWELLQSQYHTAELIIESAKSGSYILEVPISVKNRSYGESKKGKDLKYGLFFLRTVLKTWLR
ncbi:Glycosyltransferase, group 2 family protein [Pseudodesulfovibrio profundus]|uniref:Glycosyltransferase, group 2 family protein n=1 Tax=Pseudodesulfovibrio profundus TaxID=57320 RepID=A0A2C8FFE8_9BACT|nr:glycosyltransferase family 2 protein [Pseudodesulfovibrio profundus]SOB60770.1 Glycosyltransferase, group 2 family protein [Pseudodesulfovibrio profundus]